MLNGFRNRKERMPVWTVEDVEQDVFRQDTRSC